MKVSIKKLLSIAFFGLVISGTAMAEPEVGDFTLNFEEHVSIQNISVSKVYFSHGIVEKTSFLDFNYDTND